MTSAATCAECGEPFGYGEKMTPSNVIAGRPHVHEECAGPSAATRSDGVIAFGILTAAMGEPAAWALWNRWNVEQRDEVSAFADEHFGPVVRGICDELVAWATEDGTQNG